MTITLEDNGQVFKLTGEELINKFYAYTREEMGTVPAEDAESVFRDFLHDYTHPK